MAFLAYSPFLKTNSCTWSNVKRYSSWLLGNPNVSHCIIYETWKWKQRLCSPKCDLLYAARASLPCHSTWLHTSHLKAQACTSSFYREQMFAKTSSIFYASILYVVTKPFLYLVELMTTLFTSEKRIYNLLSASKGLQKKVEEAWLYSKNPPV